MALTLTARAEGVTSSGKRYVEYTATFSNSDAADITHVTSGFQQVDEVWVKAKAASGITLDLTTNNATKIALTPSAAGAHTIRLVGS
jgi:hypothetical protein